VTGEDQDPQHFYEIRVRGHLGTKMLRAFPALRAQAQGADTLLTGRLQDQAAVYGVIARLEALGLDLLELRRLRGPQG
jgi:epsilon-lactone hydrolase